MATQAQAPELLQVTSTEPFTEEQYSPPGSASGVSLRSDHASKEKYTLSWHNLVFGVEVGGGCGPGSKPAEEKLIVKGTSGKLEPGKLTAIMGPSGAGKTTMMNVLAGRAPYGEIKEGHIYLNGREAQPETYRQQLAYVMQSDALFATQTPREALNFTANLRLPHESVEERTAIVERAITALGLEKCADTYIGSEMVAGLSGGEKKRTAVAVELISSPSLIFLDEPTSGLDSHSAFELVKILRALAEDGCTIVCTIHQPSSEVFALFHDVLMLKSGHVAYSGDVNGVGEHFNDAAKGIECPRNSNPADFAMQRLQLMSDEEVMPYVNKVPKLEEVVSEGVLKFSDLPSHKQAGVGIQLSELMMREAKNLLRDKVTLAARFGMGLVLALLIGLIYWRVGKEWGDDNDPTDINTAINNHWGAVVFMSINAMFLAAQPMLLAFPLERAAFIREYTAGTYSAPAYVFAKTCVDVPAACVQQLLGAAVYYFMVGFNGNFALLVLTQASLAAVSASTALLMGAATTRAETAVNLVPAVYVPQILFSGFFISSDQVPVWLRWLQWVCPLKYGISLATVVELGA
eukprot:Rhum_TRINITY_DN15360_c1_g1::Rhum_TRINITY_DN15360_c1_g1_i1::g.154518::m.154518